MPYDAIKLMESTIEWLIKIKREFDLSIIVVNSWSTRMRLN
nr:hypothetical protein [Mycoplasmopsis bovis]